MFTNLFKNVKYQKRKTPSFGGPLHYWEKNLSFLKKTFFAEIKRKKEGFVIAPDPFDPLGSNRKNKSLRNNEMLPLKPRFK